MKMKNRKAKTAEYYDTQNTQDKLYADSLKGKIFKNLMNIVTCEENIKLAYRNIKSNKGIQTAGTDNENIDNLPNMDEKE